MLALIALLAQFALFNCGPTNPDGSFQCNAVHATATHTPAAQPTSAAVELRPDNAVANARILTPSEMTIVHAGKVGEISDPSYVAKIDASYSGTTTLISDHYWAKWFPEFDPDIALAIAVDESNWHQNAHGDLADVTTSNPNGGSWGIDQVKENDWPFTYPYSHISTAFNVDFKLMYQRACYDGTIAYLGDTTNAKGNKAYLTDTGLTKLWGCIGDWYSGWYYDASSAPYIAKVKGYYASKPWTRPGF